MKPINPIESYIFIDAIQFISKRFNRILLLFGLCIFLLFCASFDWKTLEKKNQICYHSMHIMVCRRLPSCLLCELSCVHSIDFTWWFELPIYGGNMVDSCAYLFGTHIQKVQHLQWKEAAMYTQKPWKINEIEWYVKWNWFIFTIVHASFIQQHTGVIHM